MGRDYHKEWLRTKAKLNIRKNFLIIKLGGCCARCGSKEDLEFDHPNGKPYDPRKMSPQMRMKQYEIDYEHGQLQLLCHTCNAQDGALNKEFYAAVKHGEDIPF